MKKLEFREELWNVRNVACTSLINSLSLSGKSSFDASEAHSVVPLCLRFCFVSRTSLRYVRVISDLCLHQRSNLLILLSDVIVENK